SGPIGLGDRVCVQPVFNDIDNDGDQDLFVTSARGGNALFRNDGKGKFEDITKEAGVTHVGHTQGATFFDADHDGDLDLLITNTAHWTTNEFNEKDRYWAGVPDLYKLIESKIELNIYYRNDGTGKFEDATEEAGLKGVGWGGDTIVFDYDEDGDTDLLVGNMFGHSLLYDNDGKGKFKIVTYEVLGRTPLGTVGAHVLDFDGDGHLDFYLVDMHSDMWIPVRYPREEVEAKRKYDNFYGALRHEVGLDLAQWEAFQRIINVDKKKVFFGNGLFRFVKPGQFEEISGPADAETFWPWGVAVGDFDGDGDDDVFLPSGMGYPYFYWPSRLLMNDGGKRFVEEGKAAGLDPPPGGENLGRIRGHISTRSARSASVGDFNGDGRLDLIVVNFNDRSHLYMNEWPATNYVKFRLTGTKSNRDAIGATLRVHCGDRVFVGLVAAAGGYLAQSSKDVHFGLGAIDSIDRCEIRWPSGVVQVIEKPAINKTHKVVEPAQ
ncbi:MAG: CRTAC1 family protein, partial [Planctomycetota bacterium]|nr:CRTAC1 family protein [Planctomycetota bacterium]